MLTQFKRHTACFISTAVGEIKLIYYNPVILKNKQFKGELFDFGDEYNQQHYVMKSLVVS